MHAFSRTVIIAVAGLLLFAAGALLRCFAEDLGTTYVQGVAYVTHSEQYIELSRPLVWSGAGLIVLASAGWLFARRSAPRPRMIPQATMREEESADAV